jgi:glycosyltransferase involved in cell wall biosynthesis
MARVDIVVPVYNYGRYLPECIRSVSSQGIEDFRILIVDNASTDNTVEIARELAKSDPRVTVMSRETNRGLFASYNEGVAWAEAEYFLVLCADDMLAPGCLERAVSLMDQREDVVFVHGAEALYFEGQASPETTPADDLPECVIVSGRRFVEDLCDRPDQPIAAGAVLTRTSAQKKAGFYREKLPYTMDVEMLMRLAMLGNVAKTPATQCIRREHADNLSHVFWSSRRREIRMRTATYVSFFSTAGSEWHDKEHWERHAKRRMGELAFWSATSHCFRGYFTDGIKLFAQAVELAPSLLVRPPLSHLWTSPRAKQRVEEVLMQPMKGWMKGWD